MPSDPDRAAATRSAVGRRRPRALLVGAGEEGAAVVDFVLVGVLVVAVCVALLQLALALHVRNVLVDAAGEGARRAALVGGTSAEAEARVQDLTDAALADGYVQGVSVSRLDRDGLTLVEVEVSAALPVLGLLGPARGLTVTGHAIDEAALAGLEDDAGTGQP